MTPVQFMIVVFLIIGCITALIFMYRFMKTIPLTGGRNDD